MNQSDFEQLKKAKEISDITSERDKIQQLLNCGCWEELSEHLEKLKGKYIAETLVYNLANPIPPTTLQENALNCIKFLNTLLLEKAADNPK